MGWELVSGTFQMSCGTPERWRKGILLGDDLRLLLIEAASHRGFASAYASAAGPLSWYPHSPTKDMQPTRLMRTWPK